MHNKVKKHLAILLVLAMFVAMFATLPVTEGTEIASASTFPPEPTSWTSAFKNTGTYTETQTVEGLTITATAGSDGSKPIIEVTVDGVCEGAGSLAIGFKSDKYPSVTFTPDVDSTISMTVGAQISSYTIIYTVTLNGTTQPVDDLEMTFGRIGTPAYIGSIEFVSIERTGPETATVKFNCTGHGSVTYLLQYAYETPPTDDNTFHALVWKASDALGHRVFGDDYKKDPLGTYEVQRPGDAYPTPIQYESFLYDVQNGVGTLYLDGLISGLTPDAMLITLQMQTNYNEVIITAAIPEYPFYTMGKDNYSFNNSSASFGYPYGYYIPVERFQMLYSPADSAYLNYY